MPVISVRHYFIPRSQELNNLKTRDQSLGKYNRQQVGPRSQGGKLSTLIVYIPCWSLVDLRDLVDALRDHRTNLQPGLHLGWWLGRTHGRILFDVDAATS